MTVIDERSRVPTLDGAALARLAAALELPGVVAAFLFGSQARGSADRLSDVDVAVLHDPGLDPRERFRLRLDLADAAGEALGTDEVDLVLVNDAPPLFRERALRDAVVLVDREPAELQEFRRRTLREYEDTRPQRDELSARLRRRIREGSFGRRP